MSLEGLEVRPKQNNAVDWSVGKAALVSQHVAEGLCHETTTFLRVEQR